MQQYLLYLIMSLQSKTKRDYIETEAENGDDRLQNLNGPL